jgi:curved DNA-binding protein CbpA
MFIDYYKILGLPKNATKEEIKKRYRELAKKYHPDVNKEENATSLMQEILEAYYILSDDEARERYDLLYDRFYAYKYESNTKSSNSSNSNRQESKTESKGFQFNDPILEKWILNAKKQALDFISNTYKDTKGITKNGCKYFAYALGINIVLVFLISILIRACG